MTEAVRRLIGRPVARWQGGAVSVVDLVDGTTVVAKHAPGAAVAEAAGLAWLAAAGAVPLPGMLGHDEDWLVLEHVPAGPATAAAAQELGRGLAALHGAGARQFGAAPPGGPTEAWIGRAPMRNLVPPWGPAQPWPSWYVAHRVLPYLRRAVDDGTMDARDAAVVERACAVLPGVAGPPQAPARLHGDLWSGNVRWAADGRAWLLDPAAHGGHRETDLAMLALFGCPHLARILAAYDEVAPRADGWERRVGLHQLFPLLVHVVLFGGGYVGQAVAAARSVLALA